MADTIQAVSWCIEYTCPFRQGDAAAQASPAVIAVRALHSVNTAMLHNNIYGDYCVLGTSYSEGKREPLVTLRISDAVNAVGSLEEAKRICGTCPANALTDNQLAGCCGSLMPDHEKGESSLGLREWVNRHPNRDQIARHFEQTNPPWWGLWIRSPLGPDRVQALLTILPEAKPGQTSLSEFRSACKRAIAENRPLHVVMAPPGHADLGFDTTFAHCPRCKQGCGPKWGKVVNQPHCCTACGHTFIPAGTYHDEQEPDEDYSLNAKLDPETLRHITEEWEQRHPAAEDPFFGPSDTLICSESHRATWTLRMGCLTAVVAWGASVFVAARSFAHDLASGAGWLDLVGAGLAILLAPIVVAAMVGLAAGWVVIQVRRLAGHERCHGCNKPLRFPWSQCTCEVAIRERAAWPLWRRHRRPFLRHLRRQLKWVALTWLLLLPPVAYAVWHSPNRGAPIMATPIGIGLIGNILGVILMFTADAMKWRKARPRRRLRLQAYAQTLLLLSSILALALLCFH